MVKNVSMRDNTVVLKPQRRSGGGLMMVLLLLVLLGVGGAVVGMAFLAPARLALIQEYTIGLLHGGIETREEHSFVDACVPIPGADKPQAVSRTVRTTTYRDGTSLVVTFSSSPSPTNSQCGG